MTEDLLKQLEDLVGADDFEFESEDIMEQLEEEGAGFEIIEPLLGIMERHPLDYFGMPGAMVHFIERFYPQHVPLLIESIRRAPAMHTVWMLNRCINGAEKKDEYIGVLREVAENENVDKAIREQANSFIEYQTKK